MALNHSPKIVTDGLVFAYDMANTKKSWKGQPTTNFISNPTEEMARGEFGQYRDLAPTFNVNGLVAYSLSMDIKVNKPGSVNVYMQNGSSSKYAFVASSVNATTEYQRFYFNNITPSISTPTDTVAMLATYTGYGSGVTPTVKNIQLELGSYATPFVNGTRSNTQAIIDLTGNNTITASSLTYASDGTFSFNGTSDYIDLGDNDALNPSEASFEVWTKATNETLLDHVTNIIGKGNWNDITGAYFALGYRNGNELIYAYRSSWSGTNGYNLTNFDATRWHHLVGTSDSVNDICYLNGIEIFRNSATVAKTNNNYSLQIGRSSYYSNYYPGTIPIARIYNRALSAAEVRQNFNALRGRYGI